MKKFALTLSVVCFLLNHSFCQVTGLQYTPTKSETVDLEGIQMLMEAQENNERTIRNAAIKRHDEHIEKILSYIPDDTPDAKKIAKKHIDLYYKEIGYDKNPNAPLLKESGEYILLVKYDILKDVKASKKASESKDETE